MFYITCIVWFVKQPERKTTVIAGNNLELSCRVEASPGIKVEYRWYKCKKNGSDKTFVNYISNRMTIPACSDANQGYYICAVIGTKQEIYICKINSNVAHVKVENPAKISLIKEPPSEVCITVGQTLNLECEASCNNQPVRYQWYHKAEPVVGATKSTLTIPLVSYKHSGSYYCAITSDSVTSLNSNTTQVRCKRILLVN